MVTIAVLAILLAVALPSFRTHLEDRRLGGAATGLASLIESASSRAQRGEQVTLNCTSGTDWVCTESGGSGPTVRTAGADYPGTTLTINQTIGGSSSLNHGALGWPKQSPTTRWQVPLG